jgi:group II intron reverse transcriptase/maturase
MGMLFDPKGLRSSFERQEERKAPGVDGVRKADYREGLEERIQELSRRLRSLGYRPKPVRRVYLPKGEGRYRPLGIPSFEDRLVQDRLSQILQAIWEPEFCDCSYGFRPDRSAHDALRRVAEIVTWEGTQWVVEADIKGFFDHVSHAHLMRFLEHRIADPCFLRIIRRFLKAGVMEDGVVRKGRHKADWYLPCLPIFTFITFWIFGSKSGTRGHAVGRRTWCATRMTISRAFNMRRTRGALYRN